MNIFVIGNSRSGKSPISKKLCTEFDLGYIQMSEWVRREYMHDHKTRQEFIDGITAYSLEKIRANPNHSLAFIENNYDLTKSYVIDGARNPYDFTRLFNPSEDYAVFLRHKYSELKPTDFEAGISVIDNYLSWMQSVGIVSDNQVLRFDFDCFWDSEKKDSNDLSIDDLIKEIPRRIKENLGGKNYGIHTSRN